MNILVVWILTRSRNVEFQTLAVGNLIVIESWGCLIKTYVLSRECFIIVSSSFSGPLSSSVFEVILNFLVCLDHILYSFEKAVIKLRIICRIHVFLIWVQYDNIRMSLLQTVEPVSGRLEDTVRLGAFLLGSCECPGGCCRFALDRQVVFGFLVFSDLHEFLDVGSWIRSRPISWIHPRLEESVGVAAEWTKFDALLFLLSAVLLVPGGGLGLQRAMQRVINVDVASRTWVYSLRLLINGPFVTAIESGVNCRF